jgi:hypothetical protein
MRVGIRPIPKLAPICSSCLPGCGKTDGEQRPALDIRIPEWDIRRRPATRMMVWRLVLCSQRGHAGAARKCRGDGVPQDRVARVMPVTTWEKLGLKRPEAAVVSMRRPVPPYWTGEEVPCIAPIQVDLMGTAAEIGAMMGELDQADTSVETIGRSFCM